MKEKHREVVYFTKLSISIYRSLRNIDDKGH